MRRVLFSQLGRNSYQMAGYKPQANSRQLAFHWAAFVALSFGRQPQCGAPGQCDIELCLRGARKRNSDQSHFPKVTLARFDAPKHTVGECPLFSALLSSTSTSTRASNAPTVVVDLDLEKFFDRVNHDSLMARVAARVSDKRVLSDLPCARNATISAMASCRASCGTSSPSSPSR